MVRLHYRNADFRIWGYGFKGVGRAGHNMHFAVDARLLKTGGIALIFFVKKIYVANSYLTGGQSTEIFTAGWHGVRWRLIKPRCLAEVVSPRAAIVSIIPQPVFNIVEFTTACGAII